VVQANFCVTWARENEIHPVSIPGTRFGRPGPHEQIICRRKQSEEACLARKLASVLSHRSTTRQYQLGQESLNKPGVPATQPLTSTQWHMGHSSHCSHMSAKICLTARVRSGLRECVRHCRWKARSLSVDHVPRWKNNTPNATIRVKKWRAAEELWAATFRWKFGAL
jgi:hypothetical protein